MNVWLNVLEKALSHGGSLDRVHDGRCVFMDYTPRDDQPVSDGKYELRSR